jgi:hypothetical protein
MAYREMGWHGKSGAAFLGGHITVDFENKDGEHVTTHHVYPMDAAYRNRRKANFNT